MPETRQPERLAPRATSNRNGGRDHLGILGEIKSVHPGEIIGISTSVRFDLDRSRQVQFYFIKWVRLLWAKSFGCFGRNPMCRIRFLILVMALTAPTWSNCQAAGSFHTKPALTNVFTPGIPPSLPTT